MPSTSENRTETPPVGAPACAADPATVAVGWAVGLVAFAYLMSLPPTLNLADESVILYGAKRVYLGDAAYRDFFEFLTPGSFYLYALAYALGGVSITTAQVTTALLNALTAVCIYFLTLRVAAIGEAVLAALLVVAICVPVWNMASHHWIATTLAAATAAVLLAPGWQGSTRARPAVAGVLAGALACTHQSRAVWLIIWVVVTVPLLTLGGPTGSWRRGARELAWVALGGAAVCFPIFGYALWRSSFAEMYYATVTWVMNNYRRYNVGVMPWAGSIFPTMHRVTWLALLKAIPALLALETAGVLWMLWRHGLAAAAVRTSVLLLALTAVAAITYFPGLGHVAFVTPFALVVFAGMLHRLHRAASFHTRVGRAALAVVWLAALAMIVEKLWTNREWVRSNALVRFESAFGTLASGPEQARLLEGLRKELAATPDAPAHLFAYPGDAWIYLALPSDNPTPFALLRPVYNSPAQMQAAIELIERDPAATVLVNHLFAKKHDPLVMYLDERSWRPIPTGTLFWTLYKRQEP